MAARAIWKAVIKFGDFGIPVKLYSAVKDRNIHFHLLHDQDMVRLKQRLANAETGETVAYAAAQRGFEVERSVFVKLDEEFLESLKPKPSHDIEITRFVAPDLVDPQWYDRPYFVGPDDDETDEYFALVAALTQEKKEGIAKWVMRDKSYLGALRAEDGHLLLVTLRHSEQIVSAKELEPPEGRPLDKREQKLAQQLIEALADKFDPDDYHDEYRQRVLELIEAKSKGRKVAVKEFKRKPAAKSLAKMLQASLAGAK
jgi:DNA end-binding protein Ku